MTLTYLVPTYHCVQRREGPWLSPIICETLVAYYNEVELSLPEPSFGPATNLEVNAPIGAYALCTVAVCIQHIPSLPTVQANQLHRYNVLCAPTPPANMLLPRKDSKTSNMERLRERLSACSRRRITRHGTQSSLSSRELGRI